MVEMQPDGMEQPMPMGPDMQAMYGQDPNAAGQYMDGQEEEGKFTDQHALLTQTITS